MNVIYYVLLKSMDEKCIVTECDGLKSAVNLARNWSALFGENRVAIMQSVKDFGEQMV